MRNILPLRSALLLVLIASVAVAKGRDVNVRSIYLHGSQNERVEQVYVTPDVTTVLRFEQPCVAAGTKMVGWEGRFEPVACAGKSVLIVPLQRFEPEDRFILAVMLADGTEVPFTLLGATRKAGEWPDQQVNVFIQPDTREALQAQLKETRERERLLEESAWRRYQEDTADHAIAKLLVSGDIKQTSLVQWEQRVLKGRSARIIARVYGGKRKAAVLFTVTNRDPSKSWSLAEARLRTMRPGEDQRPPFLFGEERPFALRADRDELAPGETGTLAVVVDRNAFETESGLVKTLALEIYRQDGLLDAHVILDRRLVRE
ncbi:DUF2381 family protein [Archangium lansingense]|uniref:DUF2381 family protein n=1 Tax=Archangium lansingense TaxID=2995310 RepID=A0ABT4AP88_9BACT|nr:DUF2381 family protein [Archangium lansinium]MCY1083520.1 DUF2381 family protein [Archangium lansinium]